MAPRLKEENTFGDLVRDPVLHFKQDDPVLVTLAACHTLTRIEGLILFGSHDYIECKLINFFRTTNR